MGKENEVKNGGRRGDDNINNPNIPFCCDNVVSQSEIL